MKNNIYIQASTEIQIFNKSGNIIDETDLNEDKRLIYFKFNNYYYYLDDIEYFEVLDFTKNKIYNLLNSDKYLKNSI